MWRVWKIDNWSQKKRCGESGKRGVGSQEKEAWGVRKKRHGESGKEVRALEKRCGRWKRGAGAGKEVWAPGK